MTQDWRNPELSYEFSHAGPDTETEVEAPDNWIICLWPDGTWCDKDDVEQYVQFMSDDYEVHRVITCSPHYCPLKTVRI